MFSQIARLMSNYLGNPIAFCAAILLVIIWFLMGPIFNYDEGWQLFINTSTTITTFLMVFLIQNTQNHDTTAIHLKLDEIIRANQGTHNEMLKIEELSDEELNDLLKRYEHLAAQVKSRLKEGGPDVGCPEVNN